MLRPFKAWPDSQATQKPTYVEKAYNMHQEIILDVPEGEVS
jgi:hypothetical protein